MKAIVVTDEAAGAVVAPEAPAPWPPREIAHAPE